MKFDKNKIIISSILLILFIIVSCIVIFDRNLIIDDTIYNFVMSFRCDFLDKYFTIITHMGDTLFIFGLIFAFIIFTRNIYGYFLGVSCLDGALIMAILKYIFKRDRPNHIRLIEQGGYSFPSGHSIISICVYGYLLYLVYNKIHNKFLKFILCTLLIFIIISIGISRIYVGVHYPTDVLGGYLLGTIEVLLLTDVLRLYKLRGN